MSSTYAASMERITEGLDELASIDPTYRTTPEQQDVLIILSRLATRLQAETMRIVAAADDIAVTSGARSTESWLAAATRDAPGALRRTAVLARALDERWTQVGAAVAVGGVNVNQARVITQALEALPGDLDAGIREKAEAHLVEQAAEFGPRALAKLAERILEAVAPEIAERAEYDRLLAQERRGRAATQLFFRRRGDGTTDLSARLPDHDADRLRTYLDGYTSPRSHRLGEVDGRPLSRRRGEAFCAFLENFPRAGLPRQGGTATTISVTIDADVLLRRLDEAGVATLSTGDRITAGQARRLACTAGIIPFVLGGKSVILDQGRRRRLFTDAQHVALALLHPTCTETDCGIPAAWTEAHHKTPWSRGGKTDLRDGTLLCPFHHHRAHDPGWQTCHHPNGTTTFHRRT